MDLETWLIHAIGPDTLRFNGDDLSGMIIGLVAELRSNNLLKGGYIKQTYPDNNTLMVVAKSFKGCIMVWAVKDWDGNNVW